MSRRLTLARLALLAPALAHANGGASRFVSSETAGAALPGDAGALGPKIALVKVRDIACVSENLTLVTGLDGVDVTVEYVYENQGKPRTLDYAFPFAIGVVTVREKGQTPSRRELGAPKSYRLEVDGQPATVTERRGAKAPQGVPLPDVADNRDVPRPREIEPGDDSPPAAPEPEVKVDTGYEWSYRVSPVTFAAGKRVAVKVTYHAPYLVYAQSGEMGTAKSPGVFSYILSTGDGWKGGVIGHLRVRLEGGALPLSHVQVDGLELVERDGAVVFEADGFKPDPEKNLVLRLSDWGRMTLARAGAKGPASESLGAWVSPPVGGAAPVVLDVATSAVSVNGYGSRWIGRDNRRYRIGLSERTDGGKWARLRMVKVELRQGSTTETFNARFDDVAESVINATGGVRHIYFDSDGPPDRIVLTFTDVFPGAAGERRLNLDNLFVERDESNYEAYLPVPR